MSGVAMQRSNSIVPLDDLDQLFGADDVGTGLLGLFRLGATGEHGDAQNAAGAVRQVADATDHLVGVTRIDAEVHRDFDGLVELGLARSLTKATASLSG
jgi:hypothetical protein